MSDGGTLDEAYQRLHTTGPEFEDHLSNHGPMVVEALARHGHDGQVGRWLDGYARRLVAVSARMERITDENWAAALGDRRRLGDWPGWFAEQLEGRPWTEVLAAWWPRLLPGVAAAATHGVIRVGHAVRALREYGEDPVRLEELAQALGYWAARWRPVPLPTAPAGSLGVAAALADVPRIPRQGGGIGDRLGQLATLPRWQKAQASVTPVDVDGAEAFLREVVAAAVRGYAVHAHGNPIMLVHSATAPNAVLRTLPSLPRELWVPSAAAAWSATAAIHAAYAPASAGPVPRAPVTPDDAFDLAAGHGDEHVIKLADTALDVHRWTGDDLALAAVARASDLID